MKALLLKLGWMSGRAAKPATGFRANPSTLLSVALKGDAIYRSKYNSSESSEMGFGGGSMLALVFWNGLRYESPRIRMGGARFGRGFAALGDVLARTPSAFGGVWVDLARSACLARVRTAAAAMRRFFLRRPFRRCVRGCWGRRCCWNGGYCWRGDLDDVSICKGHRSGRVTIRGEGLWGIAGRGQIHHDGRSRASDDLVELPEDVVSLELPAGDTRRREALAIKGGLADLSEISGVCWRAQSGDEGRGLIQDAAELDVVEPRMRLDLFRAVLGPQALGRIMGQKGAKEALGISGDLGLGREPQAGSFDLLERFSVRLPAKGGLPIEHL